MPIKDKSIYPKNWDKIRAEIHERAGSRCEICSIKDRSVGFRKDNGDFVECSTAERRLSARANGRKIIIIVLTVSHSNHNPKDNRRKNLRLLCQKCHNKHDAKNRAKNRVEARDRSVGQFSLFSSIYQFNSGGIHVNK